jgi:hypothetical protein
LVAIGGPSSHVNNEGEPGCEEVGPGWNKTSNLKSSSIIVINREDGRFKKVISPIHDNIVIYIYKSMVS